MAASRARAALATILILALGACSDDDHPVGPDAQRPSEQQAMVAFNALMDASNQVFAGASGSTLTPAGISAAVGGILLGGVSAAAKTSPFELSGPCPLGGSISFRGSYTDSADSSGTGSTLFDLTQVPSGCKATSELGPITFDGDPDLHVTYSVDWKNRTPAVFRWTMKGALRFRGAVTGTCSTDAAYTMDYPSKKAAMTGTMCGYRLHLEG
jgi:hypothetical protein